MSAIGNTPQYVLPQWHQCAGINAWSHHATHLATVIEALSLLLEIIAHPHTAAGWRHKTLFVATVLLKLGLGKVL